MVLTHRWRKALLIPCVAFAAATLHQGMGPADSVAGQREETITDAQKQQLFGAHRRWELDSWRFPVLTWRGLITYIFTLAIQCLQDGLR